MTTDLLNQAILEGIKTVRELNCWLKINCF